jgi:hypothetical protein
LSEPDSQDGVFLSKTLSPGDNEGKFPADFPAETELQQANQK